jgi:hypothetical protein
MHATHALCKKGHPQDNFKRCGCCGMLTRKDLDLCTFAASGGCPGTKATYSTCSPEQLATLSQSMKSAWETRDRQQFANTGGRRRFAPNVSAAAPYFNSQRADESAVVPYQVNAPYFNGN